MRYAGRPFHPHDFVPHGSPCFSRNVPSIGALKERGFATDSARCGRCLSSVRPERSSSKSLVAERNPFAPEVGENSRLGHGGRWKRNVASPLRSWPYWKRSVDACVARFHRFWSITRPKRCSFVTQCVNPQIFQALSRMCAGPFAFSQKNGPLLTGFGKSFIVVLRLYCGRYSWTTSAAPR